MTQDGGTPLHWAAREGHTAVAQLLVERGADLHAKDNVSGGGSGGWLGAGGASCWVEPRVRA